jgi:hypothetical protein
MSVRRRPPGPIALEGEDAEAHALHEETEHPVLHAVVAAGGVDRLAEPHDGGFADDRTQRFEIIHRSHGIVAGEAPDTGKDRISHRPRSAGRLLYGFLGTSRMGVEGAEEQEEREGPDEGFAGARSCLLSHSSECDFNRIHAFSWKV